MQEGVIPSIVELEPPKTQKLTVGIVSLGKSCYAKQVNPTGVGVTHGTHPDRDGFARGDGWIEPNRQAPIFPILDRLGNFKRRPPLPAGSLKGEGVIGVITNIIWTGLLNDRDLPQGFPRVFSQIQREVIGCSPHID